MQQIQQKTHPSWAAVDLTEIKLGLCQVSRGPCQVDRDLCQFDRDLCQFDRDLCQCPGYLYILRWRALINNLSLVTSHALETCHYKQSMHFSFLRRHCMESPTEFARISVFFVIGVGIDSGNDSPSDVDDNIGWKCCCDVSGCELERAGFEQMQRSSLHKLWPHLDVAWLDVVHHNVVRK